MEVEAKEGEAMAITEVIKRTEVITSKIMKLDLIEDTMTSINTITDVIITIHEAVEDTAEVHENTLIIPITLQQTMMNLIPNTDI